MQVLNWEQIQIYVNFCVLKCQNFWSLRGKDDKVIEKRNLSSFDTALFIRNVRITSARTHRNSKGPAGMFCNETSETTRDIAIYTYPGSEPLHLISLWRLFGQFSRVLEKAAVSHVLEKYYRIRFLQSVAREK